MAFFNGGIEVRAKSQESNTRLSHGFPSKQTSLEAAYAVPIVFLECILPLSQSPYTDMSCSVQTTRIVFGHLHFDRSRHELIALQIFGPRYTAPVELVL